MFHVVKIMDYVLLKKRNLNILLSRPLEYLADYPSFSSFLTTLKIQLRKFNAEKRLHTSSYKYMTSPMFEYYRYWGLYVIEIRLQDRNVQIKTKNEQKNKIK